MCDTMASRGRNARFFHPHGIGHFLNPIGRASHQVLWRRFTHCLKLKNTNRHLLASTSFKALHLGYVYVSTAFCLIGMYWRCHIDIFDRSQWHVSQPSCIQRCYLGISNRSQRHVSLLICIQKFYVGQLMRLDGMLLYQTVFNPLH
jgi:hypothetical protein